MDKSNNTVKVSSTRQGSITLLVKESGSKSSPLTFQLGDNIISLKHYNLIKDGVQFKALSDDGVFSVTIPEQESEKQVFTDVSGYVGNTDNSSEMVSEKIPDWDSLTEENYTKESLDEYANTFGINLNTRHKFETMVSKFKEKFEKLS